MSVCRSTRIAVESGCALAPEQERHIFSCRECRSLARAERVLSRLAELPGAPSPSAFFVSAVRARLHSRPARNRIRRRRAVSWAAAILLFAVAAGIGSRIEEQSGDRLSDLARTGLGVPDSSDAVPIGL